MESPTTEQDMEVGNDNHHGALRGNNQLAAKVAMDSSFELRSCRNFNLFNHTAAKGNATSLAPRPSKKL